MAVGALALTAVPASALTFTMAGQSADVDLVGYDQDTGIFYPSLGANLDFTLSTITNGGLTYNFSVTADNTSSDANARLIAYAFDLAPTPFQLTNVVGTVFGGGDPGPGGQLKSFQVDICLYAGPTCNGGGNEGIKAADAAALTTFSLTFGTAPTSGVSFDGFVGKFQNVAAVDGGSLAAIPGVVPEPASWALMITGFGAAGAMLRRRRRPALA